MTDYIKREDALEQFNDYVLEYRTTQIRGMLMDVPSADVAPVRHGKWIEGTTDLICSSCETVFNDELAWMCRDYTYGNPRYCPHCGAKMNEEETKE